MTKTESERLLSCRILASILRRQGSLGSMLGPALKGREDISGALVQELCFGVCRWYHRLDFIAQSLLDKPLRGKDSDVYCLILLGLYQLHYSRIPAHAAIHETVSEADNLGKAWARKLINAVLRAAQRQEAALLEKAATDYAVWYSHPQWLLAMLKEDWPQDYRNILDANNSRAPMTLRVNRRLISRAAYRDLLLKADLPAEPGSLSPAALLLDTPCDVTRLPGFADGLVSVQDEASQLVASLLPLAPGLRVLDACAAPGGKSCALLEAEPHLQLIAADREEKRLSRIHENIQRLGLQADIRCADITGDQALAGPFDRIVLDVPCSATGVIRRHPDIKLLRTPAEVQDLVRRQRALLEAAWPLLAPGGYLLYSTCSLLALENAGQIAGFVAAHPEARHHALVIPEAITCEFGVQLLPATGRQDGFYYALLQK